MHVLGVAHTAAALAFRHGADPARAACAAWLHDISKSMPPAEIEADLIRRGAAIDDDDRAHPATWHGPHAAALARGELALEDEELACAVALHSTADEGMSQLAKILFLADALEPGREHEGIRELRALARKDLDEAFRRTLERKCRAVQDKGWGLSPRAARAMAHYAGKEN